VAELSGKEVFRFIQTNKFTRNLDDSYIDQGMVTSSTSILMEDLDEKPDFFGVTQEKKGRESINTAALE